MKKNTIGILGIALTLLITGCGSQPAAVPEVQTTEPTVQSELSETDAGEAAQTNTDASEPDETEADEADVSGDVVASSDIAPEIPGLTYESTMELKYAEGFNVFYYEGGYKYIDIPLGGTYLVVPEGGQTPEVLPEEETQVIYQDLNEIYLAATSTMSFFDALDAVDQITMTGTNTQGWHIEAPKKALAAGTMHYAGKYSAPDYEMLVDRNCDLAIESTMIFHAPEVQEMLEDLGIPVFIDKSSYELTAFGRIEWIKAYGALVNKEAEAEAFFEQQAEVLNHLDEFEKTDKTVAFFSINSNGSIVVRKSEDFIPNMIELAGGKYIFENLKNPESNSASVVISMEEFYSTAVDADYLVYNATIEDPLTSVEALLEKDDLFGEFKAVKEHNVWQVDSTWYQSTATVGHLITDFHIMLTGEDQSGLSFLTKVGE